MLLALAFYAIATAALSNAAWLAFGRTVKGAAERVSERIVRSAKASRVRVTFAR